MSFPQTPLGITAQINTGSWLDVSSDVRGDGTNAVTISRGITSSGGSIADRGTCNLTLDNRTGQYSSRNPRSPLYGKIGRNTPLNVGIAYGAPWLDIPYDVSTAATTPDSAALSITGDIDIRIDATLAVWGDGQIDFNKDGHADGTVTLAGKTDGILDFSWWLLVTDTGCLQLNWTPDDATVFSATSAALYLAPWQRQAVRATLDVNNGSGGWTCTFYTSSSAGTAGPWTQLGTPVTGTGTTSIYDSATTLRVGDINTLGYGQLARRIHSMQLRNGIGGTVVASPDFTAQTVGASSFTDSAGCVWTVPGGHISNVYPRFSGRVPSWPPQWTTGAQDVTTTISGNARLQQLGQGQRPLMSTLRRLIPTQRNVVGYWPMEDGVDATRAASGLVNGQPMAVSGLTFAQDTTLPGSDALPHAGTATSWAAPVTGGTSGLMRAEMMLYIPQTLSATASVMQIRTTGTIRTWTVTMNTTGGAILVLDPEDGSAIQQILALTPPANTPMWGTWQRVVVAAQQSGSNIAVTFGFVDDIDNVGWFVTSSSPSATLGTPIRISGNYGPEMQGATIGHVAVYADYDLTWTTTPRAEVNAQAGETASGRLTRVCDETGVPVSVAGAAATTALMGPQPHGKVIDVVSDATTADEGFLTEALEFNGLRMRSRASLYNQPSMLDLPYVATPQPLVTPLGPPTDDDQRLVNDSTVTRTNGSSGRYVQQTGTLSVQDPPAGVGTYDENVTRNLLTDDQTIQSAGWRVHLGTWDEARLPAVTIYVEKQPSLIPQVCAIDTGSRIRITGTLPSFLPAGPLDLLVLGYTETFAQFAWHITYACVPYGPYLVGVLDDATLGRADTSGSTLAAGVSSSATVLSLTTASGPLWSSDPTDYPVDLTLGGETVTARAVGAALDLIDGTFESGVTGWTPTSATFAPSTDARTGTGAGLLTVVGTPTQAFVRPDTAHYIPATAGTEYRCSMWVKASAAVSAMAAIDWRDSSQAAISTSSGTSVTLTAGAWTLLTVTGTAPAGTAYLRPGPTVTGSPPTGTTLGVDDVATVATSTYLTSPQSLTVARAVNGISKAQSSGTPVALATGSIVAL